MLPVGVIWTLASGSVLLLLGIWVVRLSPRRPANVAIAVFVVTTGLRPMISDLGEHFEISTRLVEGPLLLASTTVLVWLALRFPDPASPGVRRAALAAVVVLALVGLLGGVVGTAIAIPLAGREVFLPDPFNIYLLAFLVPLVALPVRAIVARDAQTADRVGALASALTLYPAAFAALGFLGLVDAFDTGRSYYLAAVVLLAATPVLAALWLYAAHRGPASGSARNIALLTLAVPLLFALNYLYGPQLPVTDIARIATTLFLVVAIVRGQLLSADTAMRWTISRSSIAAAFIAVFFVASEAAQQFFGETLNSAYLGIIAAGALVFAIAPLSRVADRLAERALPISDGTLPRQASTQNVRAHDTYRRAVRLALRDRRLTAQEEVELAHVADGLGLSAAEATQLRHEVEREARPTEAP